MFSGIKRTVCLMNVAWPAELSILFFKSGNISLPKGNCKPSFETSMEMDCFANWPRSLFKLETKKYEDLVSSSDASYDAS